MFQEVSRSEDRQEELQMEKGDGLERKIVLGQIGRIADHRTCGNIIEDAGLPKGPRGN